MTKRLTAIVYNTISHGHWNEPAHGFNVSFSANGTPVNSTDRQTPVDHGWALHTLPCS